jgi:hypothetical protein
MSDPAPLKEFCCPSCNTPLDETWVSCPICGFRVKPADDLLVRAIAWSVVLAAFVLATLLIYKNDAEGAVAFGVLFGLPLVYIFGKAVLFRLRGRPMTWKDLGWTSFRVAVVGVALTVVLPLLIGLAAVVLLFAVCGAMMLGGRL